MTGPVIAGSWSHRADTGRPRALRSCSLSGTCSSGQTEAGIAAIYIAGGLGGAMLVERKGHGRLSALATCARQPGPGMAYAGPRRRNTLSAAVMEELRAVLARLAMIRREAGDPPGRPTDSSPAPTLASSATQGVDDATALVRRGWDIFELATAPYPTWRWCAALPRRRDGAGSPAVIASPSTSRRRPGLLAVMLVSCPAGAVSSACRD